VLEQPAVTTSAAAMTQTIRDFIDAQSYCWLCEQHF
jgi:hypothetical protein